MSIKRVLRAFLWALVITIVSCVLLTIVRGMPTQQQLVQGGVKMLVVAFVAFLYDAFRQSKT